MNFGDAVSRRFSRGNDADDIARRAIAVSYHQQAERTAQSEQNKPIFIVGVVGVVDQ